MKWTRTAKIAAVVGAAFLLTGCAFTAAWFGSAETPAQKAFRISGIYAYVAIPAAEYTALPSADARIVSQVCRLDQSAWAGAESARVSLEMGGDTLTAALSAASSGLASFSLRIIGTTAVNIATDPMGLAGKAVVIGTVIARSAAEMRIFRKSYLRPKLNDFGIQGREPTADEMIEVGEFASLRHEAVQAACS